MTGTEAFSTEPDNRQMRRERLFSGARLYDVLVHGNVLLHAEAADRLAAELAALDRRRPGDAPVRLLDLACGAAPITVATAIARLPNRRFDYTGVDINEAQLAAASDFRFPANVSNIELRQGSAWEVAELAEAGPFDVVFVGLNWHHGTPAELATFVGGLGALLAPWGVVANHDCYRPEGTPYLRRPDRCPRTGEDLRLVVEGAAAPADPEERGAGDRMPSWREELIARLERGYRAHGGDDAGSRILVEHSRQRDYPMSVTEVRAVFDDADFAVEASRYDPDALLGGFLAFLTARRRPTGERR